MSNRPIFTVRRGTKLPPQQEQPPLPFPFGESKRMNIQTLRERAASPPRQVETETETLPPSLPFALPLRLPLSVDIARENRMQQILKVQESEYERYRNETDQLINKLMSENKQLKAENSRLRKLME